MVTTFIPWCRTTEKKIGEETHDENQAWKIIEKYKALHPKHDTTVLRKIKRSESLSVKKRLINVENNYKSNWNTEEENILRKYCKANSNEETVTIIEITEEVYELSEVKRSN